MLLTQGIRIVMKCYVKKYLKHNSQNVLHEHKGIGRGSRVNFFVFLLLSIYDIYDSRMSLVSKMCSMTSQFSTVLILSLFSWGYVSGKYGKSPLCPKNIQIWHKNELFERSTTLGVLKFGTYNCCGMF